MAFLTPYALALIVAIGLAVSARCLHNETVAIYQQRAGIAANVERIRYYDSALTDSAQLAAETGNPLYERKYQQIAPKLDRLLKDTIALVDTPEAARNIAHTDAANRALVAIEEQSFKLDQSGRTSKASALLNGAEYAHQKRLYAAGALAANRSFLATSDARVRSVGRHQLVALLLALLGGIVLLIAGGFQLRLGRNHERIADENERRRLAESETTAAEAARGAAERKYYETQHEFTETMQITRNEDEAYHLLKRHLERSLDGSDVLVLNRNNSHDRLEAVTELDAGSPLAESLKNAEPASCLAVRLGKLHERSEVHEPLLTCELCGVAGSTSTCSPSLVGGEVIGSVLVRHPAPLEALDKRRLEESMAQASPVLANLRNLALSETRALTDGLTGLPNRRSIEDTLKRMVAQAIRTSSPLAAVLFDLDHFKQVNDIYGHEKGDEVLAAVGAITRSSVRTSDVAGRYGGEEFILLLPDTDRSGAVAVAEKLREEIAAIQVAGVPSAITASLGVAAIPSDATEPTLLLRAADRALYLAKAAGRNRVEAHAPVELEPLSLIAG